MPDLSHLPADDPFAADPPPWREIRLRRMRPAARVPTMLSPEERQLYLWLGRDGAGGRGAIVDLGCFLGGSTAHLAEGNRRAAQPVAIHAFDRFRVAPGMKRRLLYDRGIAPFAGQDILPLATGFLEPWADRVTLHRGLIQRQVWTGGPIAVLVIDAAKTARIADAIARIFLPSVAVGGLIVHQDALHAPQPWVLAQMAGLGPCCRPVAHVAPTTLVWQITRPPDATLIRAARTVGLSDAALSARVDALRPSLSRFEVTRRIDRMLATLAAHPGARTARDMKARHPPHDAAPAPTTADEDTALSAGDRTHWQSHDRPPSGAEGR
ncbi:MAG: class I SAM-dependent methyltransferase [Rhodobacteraceae bacterium]|nr:class I SAM-dependent methyltransferase [Paracoccaceae bacterium]